MTHIGRKIFAALVAVLFIYVSSPLIFPVAMGAVLATLFLPWLEKLEHRKIPTGVASSLLTMVIFLFFVLPSSLLIFTGTKAAFNQLQEIRLRQIAQPSIGAAETAGGWVDALIESPRIHGIMERITHWFPIQMEQLTQSTQELTRAAAAKLADLLGNLASHLPGMAMAMAVIVVSVYFFLVDGRRLANFFRRNSVFSEHQTDQLMSALAGTCRSVILASLVSGAVQAVVEMLMCISTGTPNVALIGILVFLGSFIPVVGSAPITLGVALHQIFMDHHVAGVLLLITAIVVMLLDNLIRPLFLRGSANLHPLLAFVAAFGGLQTLGFSGVFLGPIIAAMFVVTIQILVHADPVAKIQKPLL